MILCFCFWLNSWSFKKSWVLYETTLNRQIDTDGRSSWQGGYSLGFSHTSFLCESEIVCDFWGWIIFIHFLSSLSLHFSAFLWCFSQAGRMSHFLSLFLHTFCQFSMNCLFSQKGWRFLHRFLYFSDTLYAKRTALSYLSTISEVANLFWQTRWLIYAWFDRLSWCVYDRIWVWGQVPLLVDEVV